MDDFVTDLFKLERMPMKLDYALCFPATRRRRRRRTATHTRRPFSQCTVLRRYGRLLRRCQFMACITITQQLIDIRCRLQECRTTRTHMFQWYP